MLDQARPDQTRLFPVGSSWSSAKAATGSISATAVLFDAKPELSCRWHSSRPSPTLSFRRVQAVVVVVRASL